MKEKYLIIKVIQPKALQLATIRSLLTNLVYIEIDNIFIVSCSKSFKDSLAKSLVDGNVNYIIVYVNLKAGCDVFANGINENDKKGIENIVLDK